MDAGVEIRALQEVVAVFVEHFDFRVLEHEPAVDALALIVERCPLLRELGFAGRAGAFGPLLALLWRELRAGLLLFGRGARHEVEEFLGRRDEIDDGLLRLRVFADAQRDGGVAERDARQRARGEMARQHIEGLHVELALGHDQHGIVRLVRPGEPFEADVAVDVREELLDAHMAAQHVLLVCNLVEEAGRAVGERLEREKDGEQDAEGGTEQAEHDMLAAQPP